MNMRPFKLALLSAMLACPGLALAQGRGTSVLRTPGQSTPVGNIGGSFSQYSIGVGNVSGLSGGSASMGGDLLRSSAGAGAFSINRPPGGDSSVLSSSGLGGALGGTSPTVISTPGVGMKFDPGPTGSAVGRLNSAAMSGLKSYMVAMGHVDMLSDHNKEIASLVPSEPSVYQQNMLKGDEAFRAGKWLEADGHFIVAASIGRNAPESHLSLVQVRIAMGQYHSAAQYLRNTIRLLPELPLTQLKFRGFYGSSTAAACDQHIKALRQYVESSGRDTDALLLLAYVAYFDGNPSEAVEMMRELYPRIARRVEVAAKRREELTAAAVRAGQSPPPKSSTEVEAETVVDAAKTFWDGMVFSGKAAGSLTSLTLPTATGLPEGVEPATLPATEPASAEPASVSQPAAATQPGSTSQPASAPKP